MSKSLIASATLAAVVAGAAFAALAQPPAGAGRAPAATAAPVEHADWSKDSVWLCKPGRQDSCAIALDASVVTADGKSSVEVFKADPNPPIDCFYVYPTVSAEPFTASDLEVTAAERSVVARQFARMAAHCRPYAPMYRQTTLTALRARSGGGAMPPARGVPGQGPADVLDAFNYYMEHENHGRGFIILGHSQGAGVIANLIRTQIDGKPIQKQLVAAYIIGGSVTVPPGKDVGGTFQNISACRKPDQTGCVIAYGSYRDTVPPPAQGGVGAGRVTATAEGLCVNPAALAGGKATPKSYWGVSPSQNASLRPPQRWSKTTPLYTDFATTPGLVTTECVKKNNLTYLEVHVNKTPGNRADDIPNDVLKADGSVDASWGLHNADMNLSMGNFVDLVDSQGKAYVKAHGAPKG